MNSAQLGRLLQDAYGNYVMQSALTVSSGQLHRCGAARGGRLCPPLPRAGPAACAPRVHSRIARHLAPTSHRLALTCPPPTPCSNLVDAIRPHLPALRGTPHGKRILAKVAVKL